MTSKPDTDVFIDVVPRRTRTYNSDLAFDDAANNGEANEIQVHVSTDQARIEFATNAGRRGHRGAAGLQPVPRASSTRSRSPSAARSSGSRCCAAPRRPILLPPSPRSSTSTRSTWPTVDPANVKAILLSSPSAFYASFETAPDSGVEATVGARLKFTPTNWASPQTVTTKAVDDEFIDGGDALVFPGFEERVNAIRGPVIIDGGPRTNQDRFLTSPLQLPGEKNLPIPDGSLGNVGTEITPAARGRRSPTSTPVT